MDDENGPLSFCTSYVDRAVMIFNNFVNHGQPQAGSGFFGGKKWIKNIRDYFRINAFAIILYRQVNPGVLEMSWSA